MRLLQLATGPGEILDLHPNVTVVQGLDDDTHRLLLDAVAGLVRGEGPAGGGLLEAHGVLFDLRSDLLGLLDISPLDVDPIVRPGDLPTQPLTVDARELRTREQELAELRGRISVQAEQQSRARGAVAAAAAAVERARRDRAEAEAGAARRLAEVDELTRRLDQLAEERRGIDEQLAEVRPAREAAEAARRDVEARAGEVRGAAQVATARRSELEAERDALAVERDRDAGAGAAVERAQMALGEVVTAIEAERARDAASTAELLTLADAAELEPAGVRLERLAARLDELDRILLAVLPVEADEVAEALAMLQGGDSTERVASLEALELADELDAVAMALGGDEGEEVEACSLTGARARLDDARQALLEAEQAVRNPELDRDEVFRLEDAHERLLEAIEKADSRLAGGRARSRVTELRAAEQVILDRLGFTSYSAYMMGSPLLRVDPEKEAALDAAGAELAAAEDEWGRLERATEAALARAAVLDRRRGLLEQARSLLGRHVSLDHVQGALRAHRVPVVSVADSTRRLHAALQRTGLELRDEDPDQVELGLIAEAWLTEAAEVDRRRHAAATERAALVEEERALRDEVAAGMAARPHAHALAPSGPEGPDPEDERAERMAASRAQLEEAERRWMAHELAEGRWADLGAELDAATHAALAATEAAAEAEEQVSAAGAVVTRLVEREQGLEDERARVGAAEAEATASLHDVSATALDPASLAAEIEHGEARHHEAIDVLDAHSRTLEILDAEGRAAAREIERLQAVVAAQGLGTATEEEELEWYLLARLAAQRSVSVAGSLPLLLDDALRGLDAGEVDHLLGALDRMGEAVQVIVVSDDPLVASWAGAAGPARAAVVRPEAL